MFPGEFIFFGILHAIAVSSVLGLAFLRVPIPVVIAAALFCFLAPALIAGAFFDEPALVWLGLSTYRPRSNDFVPLFPWSGVVLCGVAAARLAPRLWPAGQTLPQIRLARSLSWAGRHSLPIYLIHQPLLFGLVYLAAQIAPPEPIGFAAWHMETCTSQCVTQARRGLLSACLHMPDRPQRCRRSRCSASWKHAQPAAADPVFRDCRAVPERTGPLRTGAPRETSVRRISAWQWRQEFLRAGGTAG
jgi:uncharacterized membrane protein